MLTPDEIESIVKQGEGYNAEFKVRIPTKIKEVTEEVCAFANAAGGVLLIGVDDNNEIKGVAIDNGKRSAIQNSIREINPPLNPQMYGVEVKGKMVWVIEVFTGSQKPYTLSGAIYVRQGPNTQKITSVEQMRDFFQQSDRIYFDEAPCYEFDINQNLDEVAFESFRKDAGISSGISKEQIIQNLKLTLPNGVFKNGAVLFFGKSPESFFDKAVIRCLYFDGNTKTQILDDKVFGGSLMHQYHQAMQWVKGKIDVRYEIEGSGPRKEVWEIPEVVFKEILINSLAHRDYYDKGGRITIEVFEDRIEVTNPGGLVSAIQPSDFGFKSHSRNPLIFGLFERIDMVEQVGSGISRIRETLLAVGLPEPVFKTVGLFTVLLKKRSKSSERSSERSSEKSALHWETYVRMIKEKAPFKINKSQWEIIRMIAENNQVTIQEMAEKAGISTRAVEKNLEKLKAGKILERTGSDTAGFWALLSN